MTRHWHWGHGIAGVYGAFALATITFVVFAVQHPVDLVSADYYARSMQHDRQQRAVENARPFADRVLTDIDHNRIAITWPAGRSPEAGTLTLYRPSGSGKDRTWPIAAQAGAVSIPLDSPLAAGRWIVQMAWIEQGRDYYVARAVIVP